MTLDLNKIVRVYTRIRDARGEKKRAFEAEDSRLKAQQEQLEAVLLKHLIDTESDASRTEAGTFYRQKEVIPSAGDWKAFYDWIKENDAFDFLERRIKRTTVTDYMDENEGALPPGVNTFTRYAVRVRKNS